MAVGGIRIVGGTQVPELRRRVLLVDDEPTIRIALRRSFAKEQYEVEEAASGEQALELLLFSGRSPTHPAYDVVVCDLRMPGLNGIELYARLRALRPDLLERMIFSTGDVISEEVAAFLNSTQCAVLHKPFELALLHQVVRELEERRRSTGEANAG